MNNRFALLLHRIKVWQAAGKRHSALGPHFKIVHRFREPGARCLPGEEIAWVLLIWGSHEIVLKLPRSLLLLFEYMAQNRRFPQNAAQIVAGLRADPFFTRHGANARTGTKLTRRFSYSGVKEYIKRLRRALQIAFDEAGLKVDPFAVLVSEPTEGNEVRYRLRATVEWIHID